MKSEVRRVAGGAGAGAVVRHYPKPPALWLRMLFFCLKPESWAAAARYPSRFTMIPLALAIVIAAVLVGASDGVRFMRGLEKASVDFPTMEVNSEGAIKFAGDRTEPARFWFHRFKVVVDPAGKSGIDVSKTPGTILFTDHEMVSPGLGGAEMRTPLAPFLLVFMPSTELPEKGKTQAVDAQTIRDVSGHWGMVLGILFFIGQMVGDLFWALMMLFFLSPLVTLAASVGERKLLLPRRAAYRMAGALLVPLILFNALMHVAGYPVSEALGGELGWLFWFFGASGLAVWTGVMARGMFGPTRRKASQ